MKRCILFLSLGIFFFNAFGANDAQATDVAVIKIKNRMAAELVPIAKGFLSAEGKVTTDPRTNSLIIIDHPESIQRIRAQIDQYDQPLEQVRIRVRFSENRSAKSRSVSADAKISGNHWSVSSGNKKKNGVDVRVKDRNRTQAGQSEYSVIATSGSPAYILAGKDIPYRERWITLSRRHAAVHDTVTFKEIETGFEVTAVIVSGQAHLKIVPRISDMDAETGIIRFTRAQTELSAPLGQWIDIGGSTRQSNEVIREIFNQGRGRNQASMSMSLMVEKP